jgi:hypothetical protein
MGIGRKEVLHRIGQLAMRQDLKTPFKNGLPGRFYWTGFLSRHPEITLKKPEALSGIRPRAMNQQVVTNYFLDLEKLVDDNQLRQKPHLVWNADETGISFTH